MWGVFFGWVMLRLLEEVGSLVVGIVLTCGISVTCSTLYKYPGKANSVKAEEISKVVL